MRVWVWVCGCVCVKMYRYIIAIVTLYSIFLSLDEWWLRAKTSTVSAEGRRIDSS